MRTVEDLRAELAEVPEPRTDPDLADLVTRGRRARLRRRAVTGTAALAVVAVAATPMVWFSLRGPATEEQPPVLGSGQPAPATATATQAKPTPVPTDSCSAYWVCLNAGDKPVSKPLLGKAVPVGASIGPNRIVLFATRGTASGAGDPKAATVYAGYLGPAARKPVAVNLLFAQDAVTAELEPLPMYRAEKGREWAVAGQYHGASGSVTAVFADGSRRPAKLTRTVVSGYTHFWLGGTGAMPAKFEAKTAQGTVSCTLAKCSSVG